jgi:hypothetical protein
MTQYYCAIFHFAHDLRQVNTLNDTDAAFVAIAFSLCLNMLIDSDAGCVAVALALCLNMLNDTHAASVTIALAQHFKKKNKICRWTKE